MDLPFSGIHFPVCVSFSYMIKGAATHQRLIPGIRPPHQELKGLFPPSVTLMLFFWQVLPLGSKLCVPINFIFTHSFFQLYLFIAYHVSGMSVTIMRKENKIPVLRGLAVHWGESVLISLFSYSYGGWKSDLVKIKMLVGLCSSLGGLEENFSLPFLASRSCLHALAYGSILSL